MKHFLHTTLVIAALSGLLAAGPSRWEIVKTEPSDGRPGYQDITVRNTSDKPLKLALHWHFKDMATANVSMHSKPTSATSRFAHPGVFMTLIAEPCHYPDGGPGYIKVEPGQTTKAILPTMDGFESGKLNLVLTQKSGRVIVGPLGKAKEDETP